MKHLSVKLLTFLLVMLMITPAVYAQGDNELPVYELTHNMTHYAAKAATETEAGNIEYWYCSSCGGYFSDAEGNCPISKESIVIPVIESDPAPDDGPGSGSGSNPASDGPGSGSDSTPTGDGQSSNPDGNPAGDSGDTSGNPSGEGQTPDNGNELPDDPVIDPDAPTIGTTFTVSGSVYKVTSNASDALSVSFIKSANKKSVSVPATVKYDGRSYKVTSIGAKAFTGKSIRTVTVGKNVSILAKYTWKGSKSTKIVIKSKGLTKAGAKGSLKGSKVKTVKVSVGSKSANKKFVKKYRKFFTRANCGKKVSVK